MSLLALVSMEMMLGALVQVVIIGLIIWVLFWGLAKIAPPEPINKIAMTVIVLIACVALIHLLLGLR